VDQPARSVVIENWRGLIEIDRDPSRNGRSLIVTALDQVLTALRAGAIFGKIVEVHVEGALATVAHATTRESPDQDPVRNFQEERRRDAAAPGR
jgi:hypothetical protein